MFLLALMFATILCVLNFLVLVYGIFQV
jgi:hypothetical protein